VVRLPENEAPRKTRPTTSFGLFCALRQKSLIASSFSARTPSPPLLHKHSIPATGRATDCMSQSKREKHGFSARLLFAAMILVVMFLVYAHEHIRVCLGLRYRFTLERPAFFKPCTKLWSDLASSDILAACYWSEANSAAPTLISSAGPFQIGWLRRMACTPKLLRGSTPGNALAEALAYHHRRPKEPHPVKPRIPAASMVARPSCGGLGRSNKQAVITTLRSSPRIHADVEPGSGVG
jgi:hypothetical protein